MNSISFDTRIRNGAGQSARSFIAHRLIGIAPGDLPAEWLPAPAVRAPATAPAAKAPGKILWVRPQSHTVFEKVLLGLLVVAAVIGIAYGFSSLVDFVQNWAAVNAGIRNLI